MSIHEDLKNWYSAQDYDKVYQFYNQAGDTINEMQLSEWDFVYIMNSLYKKNLYADCLTLYKTFKKVFGKSDMLNNKMGWCVYHLYLKNFKIQNGNLSDFFKKADYVLNNVTDGKYSAVHYIAKLAVKLILDKQPLTNDDYRRINKYLDCVKYDELNQENNIFKSEADGKTYNLASDYEWWFGTKSKCMINLKLYEECIKICDRALSTITNFHSNNDSWLKYRKSACLLKLGKFDESKKIAEDIIKNKFHHWSIYQLLYEISVAANNISDAMKYAGECSLTDKNHDMRVKFYESYANFLNTQGINKMAMLHAHLSNIIRKENNWNSERRSSLQIDEEILKLNRAETLKILKPFWEEKRDFGKIFVSGTIAKLLPSGRDGFVKADKTGKDYYFNFRDVKCNSRQLIVGTKVLFVLEERFDKKKNISGPTAVEVKLA